MAVRCAQPLKGLVTHIECGNELDTIGLQIGWRRQPDHRLEPAQWPAFRGVIRGMIAGVKAVDPTIKCGVNVGIPMAYRALQMLWNGISPNGTAMGIAGAAPLRWDFTTYHWYNSSGELECAGRNNACINVLQVLKDSFNVPIWLTEWGWSGGGFAFGATGYVQETIGVVLRDQGQVQHRVVMMYAVIDRNYGLIQADGVTKNPAYATFRNFVVANPVKTTA